MSKWPHDDLPGAGPLTEADFPRVIDRMPEAFDEPARPAPVEPPRLVRELLQHPIRWSLLLGGAMFVILWITKP